MTRRRNRASASRLFAIYSLASLVPVCVLGAVLARGYQQQGVEQGRRQGLAQAVVIEEMAVAPALRGVDLARGLTSSERARLASATDLAIFNGSVTHLRLRSFDGGVPFSDDGSVIGAVPVTDRAFVEAARGRTSADIVTVVDQVTAIRVLQPVIASSNGRAIGVLEVYLPYAAIADKVQADTRRTVLRLALGLLGLFVVLALISWVTTTALRRQAASHEHDALHDPLTGLPNRELFRRVALEAVSGSGAGGALVLLDLDHFKEVNDSLGHHAGDELLRIVSRRLVEALRTDDTVARLGGDEFGLVLPNLTQAHEAVALLSAVQRSLAQVVSLERAAISVEASFGICLYPDGAATIEDLLQHADAAMYEGKRGAAGIVVYDPAITLLHATHSLTLQHELREALGRDELALHYQPKIDLLSGGIHDVEALVRWNHPQRGLLPPSEFLSVAEHSGLIEPLTSWVLNRALDDVLRWTAAGCDWTVAVNVSARNLDSTDFVGEVTSALQRRGIQADRLCVEVTESVLAADAHMAMAVVNGLAAAGVRTSIDDFGAGYTSLAQMRTLLVAEVKIDRTFVSGLLQNAKDASIVAAIIDLGHRLGCEVTAEGVESPQVAHWLAQQGCDHAQGFLWLRPCPWTDVAAYAMSRTVHPSPHERSRT